jgi:hypothetical protein
MADQMTFVGATQGEWLETVDPVTITVTAHGDTEDGDLVVVVMGGNDVPNTGMALRAVELGFEKTVASGDVGVYYRQDVVGAGSWNFYRAGIDNTVLWHCYTWRPVVAGSTGRIDWQANVSFEPLFQPMNWQQSELVTGQFRMFGYTALATAEAEHYTVTVDDADYDQYIAQNDDVFKYQSFPDRWEKNGLLAFWRLDADNLTGTAVTATIDTDNSSGSRTDTGSGRFAVTFTPPAVPSGTLNVTPESGTRGITAQAAITAEDGGAAVTDWELDWGDGTDPDTGVGTVDTTIPHVYETLGTFDIVFTVNGGDVPVELEDSITVTEEPLNENPGTVMEAYARRVNIQELPYQVRSQMLGRGKK